MDTIWGNLVISDVFENNNNQFLNYKPLEEESLKTTNQEALTGISCSVVKS